MIEQFKTWNVHPHQGLSGKGHGAPPRGLPPPPHCSLPIAIGDYSATVNFKQEEEERGKIEAHYEAIRNGALDSIKNLKAYISFGVACAAAVGAFFAGLWFFAATSIGAGYGVFVLISNKAQRKQREQTCRENIRTAHDQLSKLYAEFNQYQKKLVEYDGYAEQIANELGKI